MPESMGYSCRRTPMELCRSHDSNFGVSKIGINYSKQSQCCSNICCRDHCSHWVCIVFNRRDRYAVVVPASDDCYRDSGPVPREQTACMSKRPRSRSFDVLRASKGPSAHVGQQIIGFPCLSPSPISSL